MTAVGLTARHRLATYGTLAPGRVNHHQVAELGGDWFEGIIRGRLVEAGWGAAHGCPGLVLDPDGDEIAVFVLASQHLPDHWPRLDAFEGAEYRRVEVSVAVAGAHLPAFIYAIAEELTP